MNQNISKKNEKVEYEWKIPEDIPTQRIIYNNEQLKKYKEREIKILKKELKEKKIIHSKRMKSIGKLIQSFRKRDLKNLSIGRAISLIRKRQELLIEKKNKNEYTVFHVIIAPPLRQKMGGCNNYV